MNLTLESAQFAVAAEEGRIGATLLVRAIVARKHHYRIIAQALPVEKVKNLAHIAVEPRYHGRELGMGVGHGIVTRALLAAPVKILGKLPAIAFEKAVVRLRQLGVRQSVGEQPEEGAVSALRVNPAHGLAVDELGRVGGALTVVGAEHRVIDILVENHAHGGGVAPRGTVAVEEVGVIEMSLELTYIAIELIDAALFGHRA